MKTLLCVVLLVMLRPDVLAQWTFDPSQSLQIDTSLYMKDLSHRQELTSVLSNDSTTYIAWSQRIKRPPGTGTYGCVYGQALSMRGTKGWGNEGVSLSDSIFSGPAYSASSEYGISLSPVKPEGFYLCHMHFPSPSGPLERLLKRITGSGAQAWERRIASGSSTNWIQNILLRSDDNGNAFILWTEQTSNLYAQRYDSAGNKAWNSPTHFTNHSYSMSNLINAGGYGFVFTTDSSKQRIHRVDTAGNASTQTLDSLPQYPLPYCVLVKSDTGSLFAVTRSIFSREIRLHRWSMDLRRLWTQPKIFTTASNINNLLAVTDTRKGVLLCWEDSLNNISLLRVNANGVKVWPSPVTIALRSSMGPYMSLVSDSAGGGIIFYSDYAVGSDSVRLHAQRIDSSGQRRWGANGVLISNSRPGYVQAISDNRHGAIVAWIGFGLAYTRQVLYTAWINANGATYPVELSAFTAKLEGEAVRLDWRTESEANNAGFEIERAIPHPGTAAGAYEAAKWQRIGYVSGNGSTNVSHTYIYNDALTPELLGQSELLYRLRQVDYDGTHEYSPVARVLVNPTTAVSLEAVYPNPALGSVLLRFALPSEQPVRLALYDVLGREALLVHEGSLSVGVHEYKAHLDQLPAGLYHVLLATPLGRQARRMVVVR